MPTETPCDQPPRFSAVIFDMDGLLLDTERIALETFGQACRELQIGDHPEVFFRCLGTSHIRAREFIREGMQGKVDHDIFWNEWDRHYKAAHASQPVPLKPGVTPLLTMLASRQLPMAVATSTRSADALQKLESAGIVGHFTAIIGGEQVEDGKPHPAIYLKAARTLGVNPADCLALEDSDNGVRAAVAAGMTVIQVPDLVAPSAALRELGHTVLGSLDDVSAFAFGPASERPA